jgi:hypothetical protein
MRGADNITASCTPSSLWRGSPERMSAKECMLTTIIYARTARKSRAPSCLPLEIYMLPSKKFLGWRFQAEMTMGKECHEWDWRQLPGWAPRSATSASAASRPYPSMMALRSSGVRGFTTAFRGSGFSELRTQAGMARTPKRLVPNPSRIAQLVLCGAGGCSLVPDGPLWWQG